MDNLELLNENDTGSLDDDINQRNEAMYIQTVTVENNNESHAMLAMESDHICYIDGCHEKGIQQCAGLRIACINWMCEYHGVNAKKQHWCGGGGCGLQENDKYCQICAKKANKESWMKLALIMSVLIFLAIVIITHHD